MTLFVLFHFLLIVMVPFAEFGEGTNGCTESRCSNDGPSIHFPFRLQHQPKHCGYPGFDLSCNSNTTILTLPDSIKLSVWDIDYGSQQIRLYPDDSCLVKLLHFNISASPFIWNVEHGPLCSYSVFSCPRTPDYEASEPLGCSNTSDSILIATRNTEPLRTGSRYTGCKKSDEISSVPCNQDPFSLRLGWLNPECRYCEGLEMDCGFKNYTNQPQLSTQCFERPYTAKESQSFIRINYGQVADDLPAPEATTKLLQSTSIQKVRLYGFSPIIIKALANTASES